jgi:hypothetical protein
LFCLIFRYEKSQIQLLDHFLAIYPIGIYFCLFLLVIKRQLKFSLTQNEVHVDVSGNERKLKINIL